MVSVSPWRFCMEIVPPKSPGKPTNATKEKAMKGSTLGGNHTISKDGTPVETVHALTGF